MILLQLCIYQVWEVEPEDLGAINSIPSITLPTREGPKFMGMWSTLDHYVNTMLPPFQVTRIIS